MSSMYETILELPLFKGIGEEQLSQLLEKTSFDFLRFEDNEVISHSFELVTGIDFILSGRVRQTYRLQHYSLAVEEMLDPGDMIGALHLYGMDTRGTATAEAFGKVSLMRLDKAQYMNILMTDSIFILNFVNYLSAAAQKSQSLQMESEEAGISRTLRQLAFSIASRTSETVMLAGSDQEMAKFCGVSIGEFTEWKVSEMAHKRLLCNQRGIFLRSPHLV